MRPNGFHKNGWERVASCKTGRIFKQFQALGAGKDTVWDCSDSPCPARGTAFYRGTDGRL